MSQRTQFEHTMVISNGIGEHDTLVFGHAVTATYCIDYSLNEYEAPDILPGSDFFETRIVNHRVGVTCLGEGLYVQYQPWDGVAAADTFRIKIFPGSLGFPIHLEWSSNLAYYYNAIILKIRGDSARIINMLSQTSEKLTENDDLNRVDIISSPFLDILSVEDKNNIVGEYRLLQNYPNPFNPATTIQYVLPVRSHIKLDVFDILGQRVASIADEIQQTGYHSMEWESTRNETPSGLYYCRLVAVSTDDPTKMFLDVKKMILLR